MIHVVDNAPLPELAISVRQPWTWAILHAGKSVENRDWKPGNPGLRFRGPVCLHASGGMTRAEYGEARDFFHSIGISGVPAMDELQRGGIVGVTTITSVVQHYHSRWFFGPIGLLLQDSRPIEFIPVKGALGFFAWRSRIIRREADDQQTLFEEE